jgi:hypothetical protein
VVPKTRQKFKNDKTNPIQKSITHYKERTNPKIAKQKRTQTNPLSQFVWRSQSSLECSEGSFCLWSLVCSLWSVWKNKPNFFTTKYALLNQKRRNGGQKLTQKNETNPILTGA